MDILVSFRRPALPLTNFLAVTAPVVIGSGTAAGAVTGLTPKPTSRDAQTPIARSISDVALALNSGSGTGKTSSYLALMQHLTFGA